MGGGFERDKVGGSVKAAIGKRRAGNAFNKLCRPFMFYATMGRGWKVVFTCVYVRDSRINFHFDIFSEKVRTRVCKVQDFLKYLTSYSFFPRTKNTHLANDKT